MYYVIIYNFEKSINYDFKLLFIKFVTTEKTKKLKKCTFLLSLYLHKKFFKNSKMR